ncbi:MAG: adenylate kinase, partial [Actinomycetota bacterium]|nr:adenylate kinase [Actinomycetota bacterium]
RRRLAVYREQTTPLQRFYAARGLLRVIDAQDGEDVVAERTLAVLADCP